MVVKYYFSSVTSNLETKKHQQRIEMILTSKKIEFESIDVAAEEAAKEKMRDLIGDKTALPPQLFNDDNYLGNFDKFEEAVENECLNSFLKLPS